MPWHHLEESVEDGIHDPDPVVGEVRGDEVHEGVDPPEGHPGFDPMPVRMVHQEPEVFLQNHQMLAQMCQER